MVSTVEVVRGRSRAEVQPSRRASAGFTCVDGLDELNALYRLGDDNVSYGGVSELVDSDREYFSVGFVITDFD